MRATDVPDIRDTMIDAVSTVVQVLGDHPNPLAGHAAADPGRKTAELCGELRHSLSWADLWFVSSELTALVQHAWKGLPHTTLLPDMIPAEHGLIVYQDTLYGADSENENVSLAFRALQWMYGFLRIRGVSQPVVSITAWQCYLDEPRGGGVVTDKAVPWVPLGRSDWPLHTDTDYRYPDEDMPEQMIRSIVEDRRVLATTWLLAQQKRTTQTTELVYDRAARRRAERSRKRLPKVIVIDVRAPQRVTGEGRTLVRQHHWWVRGHWRQTPFGPAKQYRRPVWIDPHIAGDPSLPLLTHDEVVRKLS